MKIFLIILGALILFVGIILFASIRLKVFLSKNGFLVVKYLFLSFKFDLYGENKIARKKSQKSKKQVKTTSDNKTDNSKQEGYIKKIYREKGVVDGTLQLMSLIKLLLSKLLMLLGRCKVSFFNLNIKVTGEDPAETAISYGAVSAVVYPMIGIINGIMSVKKQEINLVADYDAKEPEVDFRAKIKVRVISVVKVVLSFISDYIKQS